MEELINKAKEYLSTIYYTKHQRDYRIIIFHMPLKF